MPPLSIVFAGSPAVAVPTLLALHASPHRVLAVVTRADSPQGRRGTLTPTPVALAAETLEIPTIRANRLDSAVTDEISKLQPDLGVIVAYGGLVRKPLLTVPRLGWINLHFSVLPRWRGAAPVQRAIMAGDRSTGATVFQLEVSLDSGDVFATTTRPIGETETAGEVLNSLAESEAALVVRVVDELGAGSARAIPQVGEVTVAPKLELADGAIDWSSAAESVMNVIRGVTPEPGASTVIDGNRLKILAARVSGNSIALSPGHLRLHEKKLLIGTATTPIELERVIPAGKKPMTASDWWRGRPAGAATVVDR